MSVGQGPLGITPLGGGGVVLSTEGSKVAKAQAANGRIAAALEASYGTNPGSGFQFMRFTSDGLRHDISTTESQEVRAGRNPVGVIRTNVLGRGPVNFEAHLDPLFKNLLRSVMMAPTPTTINLSNQSIDISSASGQTATLTDAAAANAFAQVVVGQWIDIDGFTNAANNGPVHVVAKTSDNEVDVEGRTFVNEAGQTDISISGTRMVIGTTKVSLTLEKQFPDAGVYMLFLGALVNSFNLTMRSREIVTGSMEFWSLFPATDTSSQAGSVAAPSSIRPANAIDNVLSLRYNDLTQATTKKATEITLDINNNLQDLPAIGVLGPDEIALGSVSAQGTLNIYLEDASIAQQIENNAQVSLAWGLSWPTGEGMMITLPNCDLGEFEAVIPGRQGAIGQGLGFFPRPDANDVAIQLDIFGV